MPSYAQQLCLYGYTLTLSFAFQLFICIRQNMFFEAVDDLEKKIANPKLGKKKKAILQSQLKDLDPLGQIRGFLQGNGSRPVLADESEIRY